MDTLIILGVGVGLLFFSWLDYHREETAIYVFGFFMLDISRDDYPLVYWAFLLFQGGAGVAAIIYGLIRIRS